ncbi:MAG: transposase [Planctomycetota bacterium]
MGRKTSGSKIVENLKGSELALKKLQVMLQTLNGEKSIKEACEELGISEAMFYKMRGQFLQNSVEHLEPKPAGRKKKEPDPSKETIRELKKEIQELELDLDAAYARTEIALVMPHVLTEDAKKLKKRPRILNDEKIEDIESLRNTPEK